MERLGQDVNVLFVKRKGNEKIKNNEHGKKKKQGKTEKNNLSVMRKRERSRRLSN